MKQTSWLWVALTAVAIMMNLYGHQPAYAQGTGPSFRGPGAVLVEPTGTLGVVDRNGDAIFRVAPNTGDRTILSDDNTGTGPTFSDPLDMAREAGGTFVVVDRNLDAVVRVDPLTGNRTIISGCPRTQDPCPVPLVGSGPPFRRLVSIAVETRGTLIVVDFEAKAVVRVAPGTGSRAVLSSANRGRGPNLDEPMGIAVQANGALALIDTALDAVLEIDPVSGNCRVLLGCSELPDPCPVDLIGRGPSFLRPVDVAVRPNRTLAVIDVDLGAIVDVNPFSGNRTIVSDANTGLGPVFLEPTGIAVDRNRRLFVTDRARRAILEVSPASGDRQINSQAPALIISPSTGTYTDLQSFDLVLIVEGAIDEVSIRSATLNVTEDLSVALNRCGVEQPLTGSGLVIRCANADAIFGLDPGRYRFDVRLDVRRDDADDIIQLRDTVFWYVLGEAVAN